MCEVSDSCAHLSWKSFKGSQRVRPLRELPNFDCQVPFSGLLQSSFTLNNLYRALLDAFTRASTSSFSPALFTSFLFRVISIKCFELHKKILVIKPYAKLRKTLPDCSALTPHAFYSKIIWLNWDLLSPESYFKLLSIQLFNSRASIIYLAKSIKVGLILDAISFFAFKFGLPSIVFHRRMFAWWRPAISAHSTVGSHCGCVRQPLVVAGSFCHPTLLSNSSLVFVQR